MRQYSMAIPFSKTMKILIGVTVGIWLIGQFGFEYLGHLRWSGPFELVPRQVLFEGWVWQPFTYMFLHNPREIGHILLNMLMLWMMGAELEQLWGRKFFLFYYFASGVGAALLYVLGLALYALWSGASGVLDVPVVGASGAIFGLMMAYGILFGERTIHFMLLFPMKVKFFVLLLGLVEIFSTISNGPAGGGVASLAHLGGLVAGYFVLLGSTRWRQRRWFRGGGGGPKNKKKSPNLRLVVDNDSKKASEREEPRYWN